MWWFPAALAGAAGTLAAGGLVLLLWRRAVDALVDNTIRRLMREPYSSNLLELAAGFGHSPLVPTLENALRAAEGKVLHRPFGTARRFRDFSGLMFSPAQLRRLPLAPDAAVATRTVLGPRARRPLELDIPLLLGGMGYGVAISAKAALALAKGAERAGTAFNTGHGPLLPEVRQAARRVVVQFTGNTWNADPAVLRAAGMVEIRYGQGAWAGMGVSIPANRLTEECLEHMGLSEPAEEIILPSGPGPGVGARQLRRLVRELRAITDGVPIAVKLAAGQDLEAELDMVLAAGVDVIALDGAQGGAAESPPVLADDFGLPTLYGLVRAVRHLERTGARDRVSLTVGGGLLNPGEYLKCLALGADAVYLGTAALFAATHDQNTRTLPWEPPTQLMWDTRKSKEFDVEAGASSLANFLAASVDEMAVAARALGKGSLHDVDRTDLVALDPETAALTGIPLAYGPPPAPPGGRGRPRR